MKSTELRLGNWVNWTKPNPNPTYEQVYILSDNEINESLPDTFQPIPITPEIMEKAGGVRRKFARRHTLKNLEYDFYEERVLCIYKEFIQVAHCKYLHQLQNIYFALTGEELEINL